MTHIKVLLSTITSIYDFHIRPAFSYVVEKLSALYEYIISGVESGIAFIAKYPRLVLLALVTLSILAFVGGLKFWALWGWILLWQNYAFTEVSRARNSGSLRRHIKACLQSNGVWFTQQAFATTAFLAIINGQFGIVVALAALLYYTAFTMSGSVLGHYRALAKEQGMEAVGANKKFAQITVEDWEAVKAAVLRPEVTNA